MMKSVRDTVWSHIDLKIGMHIRVLYRAAIQMSDGKTQKFIDFPWIPKDPMKEHIKENYL